MRTIPPQLKAQIEASASTLTVCLKITPTAGVQVGFTRCDVDLTVAGQVYKAAPGLTVTTVQSGAGLSVDNLETTGIFQSGYVTEAQMHAGVYDSAAFTLFLIDYLNPEFGTLTLLTGYVRGVRIIDKAFTVELASLSQLVQQTVGDLTSAVCRVKEFGDLKCGINLNGNHPTLNLPLTHAGLSVAAAESLIRFNFAATEPTGYFKDGRVIWTSGNNAGFKMDVKDYTLDADNATGHLTLYEPMPNVFTAGDLFTARAGCNRTFEKCKTYLNAVNFRGEVFMIGTGRLLTVK